MVNCTYTHFSKEKFPPDTLIASHGHKHVRACAVFYHMAYTWLHHIPADTRPLDIILEKHHKVTFSVTHFAAVLYSSHPDGGEFRAMGQQRPNWVSETGEACHWKLLHTGGSINNDTILAEPSIGPVAMTWCHCSYSYSNFTVPETQDKMSSRGPEVEVRWTVLMTATQWLHVYMECAGINAIINWLV